MLRATRTLGPTALRQTPTLHTALLAATAIKGIHTYSPRMAPHSYLLADKTVNPEWRKVDDYLEPLLCPTGVGEAQEADAFQRTLESHGQKGIPAINVSPLQGMYLYNTALSIGIPRGSIRILEVGTLAGCKPAISFSSFGSFLLDIQVFCRQYTLVS